MSEIEKFLFGMGIKTSEKERPLKFGYAYELFLEEMKKSKKVRSNVELTMHFQNMFGPFFMDERVPIKKNGIPLEKEIQSIISDVVFFRFDYTKNGFNYNTAVNKKIIYNWLNKTNQKKWETDFKEENKINLLFAQEEKKHDIYTEELIQVVKDIVVKTDLAIDFSNKMAEKIILDLK